MNQEFLKELKLITGDDRFHEMEPMSRHTTFRVGGAAEVLINPKRESLAQIIRLCRKYDETYHVIGNGSNLLVGDGGVHGLVIEILSKTDDICMQGEKMTAGAGVLLAKAANAAAEYGLGGMEFAAGIPGTLGGAVVMNAGAYGGEMKDIIEAVTVIDKEGNEKPISVDELQLGYRKSCIAEREYIVKEVVLHLYKEECSVIREKMEELKKQRCQKQPLEYASAGSTFKRPEGYFAGKLIMDAGLRGYQVGGAQVSEKHCGFVINRGNATAADICRLMQDVAEKVKKEFGVMLEPEVKMLGEFL